MMQGLSYVAVALVAVTIHSATARKLPSDIEPCKQSDPNYEQCTIKVLEKAQPHLAQGIPKIKMPALEPLSIPQLQVNRDQENIKMKATLKDLKAWGGSNFKVHRLKVNFDKNTVEGRVSIPLLYVETDYDVDGRVLLIPVKGKGHFIGNITDVVADFKSIGDFSTSSKGVKHMVIKDMDIKVKVNGDPIVQIKNTDQDSNNKLLNEAASNVYHQNSKEIMNLLAPMIDESASTTTLQIANQVLKNIAYDELFPQ